MRSLSMILAVIFMMFSGVAFATTDWQQSAVQITSDSDLQTEIDSIFAELFQTPLHNTFCQLYGNAASLNFSLGVSLSTAQKIYQTCSVLQSQTSAFSDMTKMLPKSYYISFIQPGSLDSWTDYGNRTYIFADQPLNHQKLKSILLHEMVIAVDSKTGINPALYSIYMAQMQSREQQGRTTSIQLSTMSPELTNAFKTTAWMPVRLTFAALRAFNIERLLETSQASSLRGQSCASDFKDLFALVEHLPAAPSSTSMDQIASLMSQNISKAQAPSSDEQKQQMLDMILSENLHIKDFDGQEMSFCEFMTKPLLAEGSLFSFLSDGPRPRLTGGTGGQGFAINGEIKDQPRLAPQGIDTIQASIQKLRQQWQNQNALPKPADVSSLSK